MSNMSYCRFENTANDLEDCLQALEEMEGDVGELSPRERLAAFRIADMAREIADNFADKIDAWVDADP